MLLPSSRGGQWLQSSGLEGWGRLGPAWKLSSLQGGGQRGGGASPQSCTALTLEQDPNTAEAVSPDQLNLAALDSPKRVIYKSIHA